ncbi:hypothetical protein F5Y12DRAFT_710346 [Xylaria sp. FL1777]|nr:hypothetical protein F5Y12DRAFT_710346 [Xylaria sp. FL1777]
MAEVFGVVSGAIGVLDVSTRGIQRLQQVVKTWINAPAELLALQNEVEDLRYLLDEIQRTAVAIETTAQQDAGFAAALREQLRKARDHHQSLEYILDEMSRIKRFKKKFNWVRREGRVANLKRGFQQVREQISNLLVVHSVIKTTRIGLDVVSISTVGDQRHRDLDSALDRINQRLDLADSRNGDILDLLSPVPVMDERVREIIASMSSHQQTATPIMVAIEQLSQQVNSKFDALVAHRNSERLETRAISGTQPPSYQYNSISIHTRRRGLCLAGCPCSCHTIGHASRRFALPQSMARLLGSLFVRYTGWPISLLSCNWNDCRATQTSRIQATYVFPTWLVWYQVCVQVEKVSGRNFDMVFATRNRIPMGSSPLFYGSHYGDFGLVARLLRDEPYRLNDIDQTDGSTPLMGAVSGGHVEVVKLLLQAGADPNHQADDGDTVRMIFARTSLMRRNHSISELSRLLGIQEFLEEADIPELTKAVLHLPNVRKLEDLIQTARSKSAALAEATRTDDMNFTTLHWACSLGDHEAVRMLITLGADVNAKSPGNGYTPLHCAVASERGGAQCITLLCKAGAELHSNVDVMGLTPLNHAGMRGSVETVEALVDNGAPVGARDHVYGYTVLHNSAGRDNIAVLDWLLDRRLIDIDSQSTGQRPGGTPLNFAMSYNAHRCVESLLRRGADYLHRFRTMGDIWTILHLAADRADVRILLILANHGLAGVDIHATRHGRTAQEMFNARKDRSDELVAAFGDLLAAIEQATERLTWSQGRGEHATNREDNANETEEGDEVFHDALELLSG